MKKLLYLAGGFIGLGLGALGAALPLLPAFPFLLLAAYCFARSSERLHRWFVGTRFIRKTWKACGGPWHDPPHQAADHDPGDPDHGHRVGHDGRVPVGRVILGIVWAGHVLYFIFGIRTLPEQENSES